MDSITELFATIQNNSDHKFPRQELKYLIAHPEESIPMLLHVLEDIIQNVDVYYEEEHFIGHLYAFFLLAQFREKQAYPIITQFFSLHDDEIEEMCGDFVTEDLSRVLASVFDGDLTPIMQLIEDTQVNEWIRGSVVKSVTILVLHGIVPYDEGVRYFQELFSHKLERERGEVWNSLVVESIRLCPEELESEIRWAFDDEYIDRFIVDESYFNDALSQTKEDRFSELHNNTHYTLIADTIAEMEWWAAFNAPRSKPKINRNTFPVRQSSLGTKSKTKSTIKPKSEPDIGRNSPCHCSSGKKYKKCCWPN